MESKSLTIALVGNPNTGKSTIFNALTGLRQKIANYPGITVERKAGTLKLNGLEHKVIDLPGTYSLNHKKIDERIAYRTLTGEYEHEETPDLVVVVLDSSNLDRNLYLATQVMDLGLPVIVLLNMQDIAAEQGISLHPETIEQKLDVPVLPITAKKKGDIDRVKQAIADHDLTPAEPLIWNPGDALKTAIGTITEEWLKPYTTHPARSYNIEALRLISDNQVTEDFFEHPEYEKGKEIVEKARTIIEKQGKNAEAEEVLRRYEFIGDFTPDAAVRSAGENAKESLSDKIDTVVTHKVFGPVIFVAILLLMFQSIFSWAEPFMNLIDWFFIEMGSWVASTLPPGILNNLLVEGIIAGLGGVIIFLPQIVFLFFFISILEGSGYMARAAFVMDGLMTRIGLHGRSVVPLMSGFACAIPGIMAARTIENWRDRMITIMVLPFMACSARLPVYALMIAAFIPSQTVLGIFTLQGLTFFGLYFFGIVMAMVSAFVMKKIFPTKEESPFLMELASYKMPKWSTVAHTMFDRGKVFVTEAGKIIMAISVVLWFLSSFPKQDTSVSATTSSASVTTVQTGNQAPVTEGLSETSLQLRNSYAGQIGQLIEPVVEPLGFDWKIGIGLITSFAAREVMVGTLNTIYSIEDEGEGIVTLQQRLINDKNPETGEPVYSTLTAISLMVFFALAMQCMSTIAVVKRETNSWKWPAVMFSYMTILAYLSSLTIFQVGTALGW